MMVNKIKDNLEQVNSRIKEVKTDYNTVIIEFADGSKVEFRAEGCEGTKLMVKTAIVKEEEYQAE